MRILIDICHPAHVHFFRNPVELLRAQGHEVLITSRVKEIAVPLLDRLGWEHQPLSSASTGIAGLFGELLLRNAALYRVVRRWKPDVMAAIGGIFVAQVGFLSRVPSVVFYDTENARLQNLLTYPFASLVAAPRCYRGWLPEHSVRYPGYHELSYLHPGRFRRERKLAIENGLDPDRDTFLIRLVAWKANHDIGERGWNERLLEAVVAHLRVRGKVIISSESPLPKSFRSLAYRGDPLQIHQLMAFCRLHVGESATMASESAVLGVPAIYAARTGRGYTDEQELRYGLVRNVRTLNTDTLVSAIDVALRSTSLEWSKRHTSMLEDTVDVAEHVVRLIVDTCSGVTK